MATVTHGLKDGIDEILEKATALERMLRVRAASVTDEAKREIIERAVGEIAELKRQATATRAAIDDVRTSLRDH
jgi:hypothetical protein